MNRGIQGRPGDPASYGRALWILWFGTVAVISDIYIAQPILPLLGAEFMVSPPVASLAVSFTIFSLSCGLLICGPLSDLVGRRPVMVLSSFLLTVPTALIALATDFESFLFFRSLQGLFVAGIAAIAMAYIAEEFPPPLVGRGMGIYVSSMIAAGFFGRVFGGVLSGQLGWRMAFIIFSVLNLAGGVLMHRYLPPSSRFRGKSGVSESLAGLFRHLGSRRLLGVFIIAFMLFFTFTGAFTYVTFHLSVPPYSLSTTSLGLLFFIYIAGIVSPVAGSLSSRYGRTPVICAGLITATGGILLTFLPCLWVIIGGLFLLCAGLFISQPAASALVGDLARQGKGSASSLYLFFYYAGGGAGAIIPGLLWNSRGWRGVAAICLLSIGTAFISLFTLCRDSSQNRDQRAHSG